MQIKNSILVRASAERVFRIYEDVAHWHTWDPDTLRAAIDGPFLAGTRGSLTPTKGRTVCMLLTKVVPNASFTVECRIPLLRMVFEHDLVRQAETVEVVHRASFSGLLTPLIGRILVNRLERGLPVTLANLKLLAEGAD